ncbi:hypothetical protein Daesc_007723 [Daldinia eschscholtzii]|uniref:Aminoglycoside phosphotransferase domain-containing protein n=1 Tax=Daldinia eschscholtzii TaxID=292717 RepID=A0AAX6MG97_9PEZI
MALQIPELPYFAPQEELPHELPNPYIVAKMPEFQDPVRARQGIRINDHYVVKFGLDEASGTSEAINMLIVRKYTSIRIPTLYAAWPYNHNGTEVWVLLMEAVDDLAVDEEWFQKPENQDSLLLDSIKRQLQEARLELRRIPHPGTGYNLYGHLRCFKNPHLDLKMFSTAEQARDWLFHAMVPKHQAQGYSVTEQQYAKKWESAYDKFCGGLTSGDEAIFTHFNLSPSAVKVQRNGRILITGWEFAGFFPPEFEYVTAYKAGELGSVWSHNISRCLSEGVYDEALELIEKTAE